MCAAIEWEDTIRQKELTMFVLCIMYHRELTWTTILHLPSASSFETPIEKENYLVTFSKRKGNIHSIPLAKQD